MVLSNTLIMPSIYDTPLRLSHNLIELPRVMISLTGEHKMTFICETPELHASPSVQFFIEHEISRPSKHWVQDVLLSKRECENVKLRTDEFVLLPDTNAGKRHVKHSSRVGSPGFWGGGNLPRWASTRAPFNVNAQELSCHQACSKVFNWLAIMTDPSMRSIRDLRAHHVPQLEEMQELCLCAIEREMGVDRSEVMVYANYPPSIYRLHFHFCAPFASSSAFDAFRMHPLSTIINNLKMNGDYFTRSNLRVPVHANSDLHRAFTEEVT